MKPLFLMDFYIVKGLLKKYYAIFLLFTFVLIIMAVTPKQTTGFQLDFFNYCLLYALNIVPVMLCTFSKDNKYIATLPYKKTHFVSEKYLIGLLVQFITLLLLGITQAIRMLSLPATILFVTIPDYFIYLASILFPIQITTAILLYWLFKDNPEDQLDSLTIPIYYLVLILLTDRYINGLQEILYESVPNKTDYIAFITFSIIPSIIIYALFWLLSIHTCKKRESK